LLEQYCNNNELKCPNLKVYNKNRNEFLNDYQEKYKMSRIKAKKLFVRIINGSGLQSIKDEYKLNQLPEFIESFYNEMKSIRKSISEEENLESLKEFCNFLFEIEHTILISLNQFFSIINNNNNDNNDNNGFDVLIYDGGLLRKNKYSEQILRDAEKYIKKKTFYSIKLISKPLDDPIGELMNQNSNFFTKYIIKIRAPEACYIDEFCSSDEDNLVIRTKKGLFEAYDDKVDEEQFKELIQSGDIPVFKTVDFYPPPLECPDTKYNLYTGKRLDTLKPNGMNPDMVKMKTDMIENHIKEYLCANDDEVYKYVMTWIANRVHEPALIPKTALVFQSEEGIGKSCIFDDFIGQMIIGKKHFESVIRPERAFGHFNGCIAGKTLILINEVCYKDSSQLVEAMKSFIVETRIQIEKKGKESININNFAGFIYLTNNQTPLVIKPGDRRFLVIQCDSSIANNFKYFTPIWRAIKSPDVAIEFAKRLEKWIDREYNWVENRPTTDLQKEIILSHIPFMDRWLINYCLESQVNSEEDVQATVLFKKYKKFLINNGLVKEENLNSTKFGRDLSRYIDKYHPKTKELISELYISKGRNSQGNHYTIRHEKLLEYYERKGIYNPNDINLGISLL
jgi:hypothetical protein